jgi:hypothetical protein
MKRSFILGIGIFTATSLLCAGQDVQLKTTDGVPHAINPAKPLKGTIVLDIERTLTINPYDFPDFGMHSFDFVRNEEGDVILYNSNEGAVHRFDSRGRNLGPLSRRGQGPGELMPTVKPFFMSGRIWVASSRKLIEFDPSGSMRFEISIKEQPELMIDQNHYLARRTEKDRAGGLPHLFLSMIMLSGPASPIDKPLDFFGPVVEGVDRKNGSRFIDYWGGPRLCCGYDPARKHVYAALNREYQISVFDLAGKLTRIIGKEHVAVKTNLWDVEKAYSAFAAVDPKSPKEIADIYPKTYAAFKKIEILKNGYVLVFRIVGMRKLEIDVFDPDGLYVYALQPPRGMSFEWASFHGRGFAVTEQSGDFEIYSDYRIKNLPRIFN